MDYGTDLKSGGSLDSRGQIPIVSGLDNLRQSIRNRLMTYKGTYSYINDSLGSDLREFIGEDNNEITRALICLEIETVTLEDPRISKCQAYYENGGEYKLQVTPLTDDEEDFIIEGGIF
ncbi:DUF2634 domain-containing protein [Methanobrevibacter arboriphilus]|uniref:contractile injection system sheath initiator n=1 Tax=Methanobrevibacter arboriphilus TaxID=39441 RepID=UPI0006D1EE56|nr:DUF2634 domain-containing protein [Methanobrevibacter arboriphilus]